MSSKLNLIKMALTMRGGVKIPLVGLGTWQSTNEKELETALEAALEIGYRHIDTAAAYQNEHVIGKVLSKWFTSGKLKRKDIFVTTKLPMSKVHPDFVESSLTESLQKLQLDYVDLYLIHFPIYMKAGGPGEPMEGLPTDHLGVWKKMEQQVDVGKTKTIGLSNFNLNQIDRLMKNSRIKPANLQTEIHVYNQEKKLVKYCQDNDIVVVAYSSLGSPGSLALIKRGREDAVLPNILGDPVAQKIAEKHKKTTGQVVLRYLTQKNIIVIPKSVKPERVKENFNILDFTLDAEDINALENLDKGEKGRIFIRDYLNPRLMEHPEYPFGK